MTRLGEDVNASRCSLQCAPFTACSQVLYALKSRCGRRLGVGDFALTSDAVVFAVKNSTGMSDTANTSIVAVVEMLLRQPDGSLPLNWPFPFPPRRHVSHSDTTLSCA